MHFSVVPRTLLASKRLTSHLHKMATQDRNRCPQSLGEPLAASYDLQTFGHKSILLFPKRLA
jgi:hypothetical protein